MTSPSPSRLPVRFGRNTASAYLVALAGLGLALVVTPILTGHLGKTAFGVWALAGSSVAYLELFQLGFSAGTTKLVAEAVDGSDDDVRAAVATSIWSLVRPAVISLVLGLAGAAVFPLVFDVGGLATASRVVVVLLTVNIAVSIVTAAFAGVLQAYQRHARLNVVLASVVIAQWSAWGAIALAGGGIVALAVVAVAANLAGQAAITVLALRVLPATSLDRHRADRTRMRRFTGFSIWLALIEIASVVIERVDLLLVGAIVGVPEAAVYAVGVKLSGMAGRVIGPASVTFLPHASALSSRDDTGSLRDAFVTATKVIVGVAAPVCVTLVLLAPDAVHAWVGPSYRDATVVVVCLSAASLLGALKLSGLRIVTGMGLARVPAIVTAGEAAANVVLDLVLAPRMGIAGVAIATIVASAVANLVVFVPWSCRTIGVPLRDYVLALIRAHGPAVGATVVAWVALLPVAGHGRLGVLAAAGALGTVHLAVFAATGVDRDERRLLLALVRRRPAAVSP